MSKSASGRNGFSTSLLAIVIVYVCVHTVMCELVVHICGLVSISD